MPMIEFLPSREAGDAPDTPQALASWREGTRWLRETPQGRASMQEVIDFVRDMHHRDLLAQNRI